MFDKLRRRVAESKGMPKEILLDLPLITIVGSKEMSIENFKGIVEYTDDCIRVNTGAGVLKVQGRKLLLKQITSEIINISGVIKSVEL